MITLNTIIKWLMKPLRNASWLNRFRGLVLIASSAIMLAFALSTPYDYAEHDSFAVDDYRGGHAAYIWWMSDDHLFEIPSWDTRVVKDGVFNASNGGMWSWNNPPLYYWLMAIPVWFARLLTNMFNLGWTVNGIMFIPQVFGVIIMIAFMLLSIETMHALELDDRMLNIGTLLFCSAPILMYESRSIGNDVLLALLFLLGLRFLMTWWHEPSLKNSVIIALITGLACMTKVNGFILMLIAFIVFIIRVIAWFHENRKTSENKTTSDNGIMMTWFDWLKDAGMFTLIAIPLSFWYQLYEYVKFHVPLFFVQRPFYAGEVKGYHNPEPMIRFNGGVSRWFHAVINQPTISPEDSNIPVNAVKTYVNSLFVPREPFLGLLQWIGFGLGLIMLIIMFIFMMTGLTGIMKRGFHGLSPEWIISGVSIMIMGSFYVYCCYREPVTSTPNVRYIIMLFPFIISIIMHAMQSLLASNNIIMRRIGIVIMIISILFAMTCFMINVTLTIDCMTGIAFKPIMK